MLESEVDCLVFILVRFELAGIAPGSSFSGRSPCFLILESEVDCLVFILVRFELAGIAPWSSFSGRSPGAF